MSSSGLRAPVWLMGWALAAAILIVQFGRDVLDLQFSDPDNAMWLVSARDMLSGQGWWDNVQHRLNPPDGTEMHWARWITGAIATLVAVLRPLVGQHSAEVIVAFAWPLAMLAAFMSLIVRICGELGARDGLRGDASVAGALVAALAFPTLAKFAPGAFDHHGVEVVLTLVSVLGLLRMAQSPRQGGVAGAALGLAMATAAEGVPFVVAGVSVAGLLWLSRPQEYRLGLAWMGLGLATSSAVLFPLQVPPAQWSAPVCDAMSTPFLGVGLIAGAVALTLGRGVPEKVVSTVGRRLAVSAALGGVSLVALWLLFPQCAGGGYSAMSPDMKSLWLSQISEARTLASLAVDEPWTLLGSAGAAFAGLVAAAFYLRKRWRNAPGWIVLGFLIASWAVMAWQVRGDVFATAFAIPFGAWGAVRARQAWKSRAVRAGAVVFAVAVMSSASAAWGAAGVQAKAWIYSSGALADYQQRQGSSEACLAPEAFADLARLEPSLILNQFTLGPAILQRTSNSVTAAQYHRDVDGLMTMIAAMRSSAPAARPIVMRSGADYVAVCAALPETQFYASHPANGATPEATLSSRLAAGRSPDWLEPVPLANSPIKLYRVVR